MDFHNECPVSYANLGFLKMLESKALRKLTIEKRHFSQYYKKKKVSFFCLENKKVVVKGQSDLSSDIHM